MIRNLIAIMVLSSLLLACQHSPQKNYFILSAAATAQLPETNTVAVQNTNKAAALIGIGPVEIADYLDRSYMGYAGNDNRLTIVENDYWAEPLDKAIARVTVLNLSQLNHGHSFIGFPWRSDSKPQYSLHIQLHSLTRSGNQASLNATWELIDNTSKNNLKRKSFTRSTSVEAGTNSLVQGYSKLLASLAEEINQSLISLP